MAWKAVQLEVRVKHKRAKAIMLPDRTNLGVWNQHNKFTSKARANRLGQMIDQYRSSVTLVYSTTEDEATSMNNSSDSSSTSD